MIGARASSSERPDTPCMSISAKEYGEIVRDPVPGCKKIKNKIKNQTLKSHPQKHKQVISLKVEI